MGYISALETCSAEVRRGVEWLMSSVDVDNADVGDAEVFYVLKQFDQELVPKYLERAKDESFWLTSDWVFQEPASYVGKDCWFLAKLGLGDNPFYMQQLSRVKVLQNREGQIWNPDTHIDILRTLVLLEPDSDHTEKAVHCLIDNLKEWDVPEIAVGVLALTELDYVQYQREIDTGIDRLLGYKNEDGGFIRFIWSKISETSDIFSTSWVIQAISRIMGYQDSSVQEAVNWLKQQQNDDGSWGRPDITAHALLALMSAGGGPKISLAEVEWKEALLNQRIERAKPHFVHTAPISNQRMPVKDIHLKIESMLDSAETEIKILSPYINLMYEHIISSAKNDPAPSIKLITRNLSDTKGKIGRNALDLLKKVTKGNIRENEILHARMIIVDDKEALISSADLTRDQLIDEFNAGIWVRDEETVKRATDFFDNIWEESEKKK